MSAFLDADCVIGALFRAKFLEPKDWKQSNKTMYAETFWRSGRMAMVTIEIIVDHDVHKISRQSITIMSNLHHAAASAIVDKCSIK
jgi:hypothetical protein